MSSLLETLRAALADLVGERLGHRGRETLSATCTRPDPEVLAMLDETRATLQAAEAMQARR